MVFCLRWRSVCVANTHSHSLAPMPKASAPKAPCVRGVAVAADERDARQGEAELRTDDVDDAVAIVAHRDVVDPEVARSSASSRETCRAASPSRQRQVAAAGRNRMIGDRDVRVGAAQPSGLRAIRPAKACGLDTSCTRCRSI